MTPVHIDYTLLIKGMPEEIEEKQKIEKYPGVEWIDHGDYIRIEVERDGLDYLKDTFPFFESNEDWSWWNVKAILEQNGYKAFNCEEEDILAAEEAAKAYYQTTVFSVIKLYVKEVKLRTIVFGVHCNKGDQIVDPDRTIEMERVDGVWVKKNEGY